MTTPEKFHPTAVTTTQGSAELGRDVMSLRYDLFQDTLRGMVEELDRQVKADTERGRPQLAALLTSLRTGLVSSLAPAHNLANFCKPWIDAEIGGEPSEPVAEEGLMTITGAELKRFFEESGDFWTVGWCFTVNGELDNRHFSGVEQIPDRARVEISNERIISSDKAFDGLGLHVMLQRWQSNGSSTTAFPQRVADVK